jgi:predicted ATPase
MIKSVQIKNFKSVVDLTLELGSFNVLVGENGCGKSNIIESIAFGAAASADKLDFEFLGSRGIRMTNPEFMFSAFGKRTKKWIDLEFNVGKKEISFQLIHFKNDINRWQDNSKIKAKKNIRIDVNSVFNKIENKKTKKELSEFQNAMFNIIDNNSINGIIPVNKNILIDHLNEEIDNRFKISELANYIVFTPEQSSLRKFEDTQQIYPLGIKGEGLFQYLKELSKDKKNAKTLEEIKNNMALLDWYDGFELPTNLMHNEFSLNIKDKYLDEKLQFFDQRSTNEGFLFLLFYSTLFIAKGTPTFFAIDNIDASFNPKLCMKLTQNLAALAKKHKKQVIVTTQNPAILDGLNLKDDSQRLFVISRNDEGHTRAERINYNEKRTMKLSEIWTKGFIGGLPSNF